MKKALIAAAIVVIFAAYAIYQNNQNNKKNNSLVIDNNISQTPSSDTPPTSASSESINPSSNNTSSPTSTTSNGKYKDGSYTGIVADAFYGKMQVQAVIEGGKITDVKFLQYPNDRGETTEVSNRALPILKSEAIAAQGAKVDVVSGATQDWEAFIQTMQSALDQAS